MPLEILPDAPANDDWTDVLGQMPELPAPGQRWTVRRKAAVNRGRARRLRTDRGIDPAVQHIGR